jgi:hypothetical protein
MSVADTLRAELAAKLKLLSPEERVALALELGRRDVALYAATHALSPDEARRRFRAQRRAGRVPSRCTEE